MPSPQRSAAPLAATADDQGFAIDAAMMNGVLQPSRQMAELASTMGAEVLRFASRRLHAQAEYFDALTRCRTMQDMMERQMEFLRRAGSEYTEELGAVMKLAQPAPADSATQPQAGD